MNGKLSIRTAGSEMSTRWDAYVDGAEPGELCFRFAWKPVFESTYGLPCKYLFAERDGNLVGILPLVVVAGLFSGKRLVSLPFLDRGGILAQEDEVIEELFSAAADLARSLGVQGIDLRGGSSPVKAERLGRSKRFRFPLALPNDVDQLWAAIGGKVRNQIRKSEKSGLQTEREDDRGLNEFFTIFAGNMRDLGSPVHSRRLFEAILLNFGAQAQIYITRDAQGQAVAGGVAIHSGDTVTVPWASSLRSARSSCPNHSLYWRILQDAVAASSNVFDFGRSTEGTGTYRFKKQWKAEPEPLIWSSFGGDGKVQEPKTLDPRRNRRLAQTWSRLPLPLANALGPRVRKHLSN